MSSLLVSRQITVLRGVDIEQWLIDAKAYPRQRSVNWKKRKKCKNYISGFPFIERLPTEKTMVQHGGLPLPFVVIGQDAQRRTAILIKRSAIQTDWVCLADGTVIAYIDVAAWRTLQS